MPLMKKQILADLLKALDELEIKISPEEQSKIQVENPDSALGDYSTNAALVLSKQVKTSPKILADKIIEKLDKSKFEKVEQAGPGFINFTLSVQQVIASLTEQLAKPAATSSEKILVEYFQPNIAKPLHIGHLRTAIIGDTITRMLKYQGHNVESDTHMGDWGTQFGILIAAYKDHENKAEIAADPIPKLNELYIQANSAAPMDSG
ncbi:MAG: arginine--tRNA ligase, partial [Candidatus Doudnabacteria bacterium]|nr:arginine--tRNA ligase [Candidatus Doudnabacteria bacterium]